MLIEKQKAALNSVFAAVFLTAMKIAVGIFTGSLGILSEALHSTLDLCAAVITFFAVRISDKPADTRHHYGHGKLESFSALIETVLLFITCGWIIYEAIEKLFFGKSVALTGIHWGIITILISIAVDYSRVKVLKKAAKQHGSQALEADALHFSSDIWSSSVVIAGLICVWIGDFFSMPLLAYADPIAALGVALLVMKVSIKLGQETIEALLDTAPKGIQEMLHKEVSATRGVLQIAHIRVRPSGPNYYIDINVGVDPNQSHRAVHLVVHEIRERIHKEIPRCDIVISTFPAGTPGIANVSIHQALKKIVGQFNICTNVHNVHVYEIDGRKSVTAHIELKDNLTLTDSHDLSHRISNLLQEAKQDIEHVNIHFECAEPAVQAEDITESHQEIVTSIRNAVNKLKGTFDCHEIRLYRKNDKISTFLHCGVHGNFTVEKLEAVSQSIKNGLKSTVHCLENVHIHFEPPEDGGV